MVGAAHASHEGAAQGKGGGMSLVDCHVHLAALPDGRNGCLVSRRALKSLPFRYLRWKLSLGLEDPSASNRKYVTDLVAELRSSRHVDRAVVLGMDGIYDSAGRLDEARTDFLVANDHVLEVVGEHAELLAGVSINPRRRDAVEELHRCAERGAVLVKVLPNTQRFDPADPAFRPFYRALAERKLPLLSHVGYEFTLSGHDQSFGDPARLRAPLDEGVMVIAAHACSSGLAIREQFFPSLLDLVRRHTGFHADVSGLTLPNRCGILFRLRRHPELHPRLLFGTDYPLPVLHLPAWGRVGLPQLREIVRAGSRFDRQVLVCRALGVGFRSFEAVRSPA